MPASLSIRAALAVLGCSLLAGQPACGMEHVTLSNGFAVECHHRGTLADGKVRLFLDGTETSYLDVDAGRIQSSEKMPDQLPAVEATHSASAATSSTASSTANHTVEALLAEQGQVHHLNVDLLKSVVNAESGGNANAVSRTGARGLMQLMPATAKSLGVTDSCAPDQNLRGGTTYLDQLLTRYHDNLVLALAAYNAGPAAVDRYHGVPPYRETQVYVARIVREFNRRSLLAQRAATAGVQPTQ